MLSGIAIGVRAVHALLAIIVLGLSVTLMKGQKIGSVPTTTRYSVFLGAYGIIVTIIGLLGLFFEFIPNLITMGFDAAGALLFLGGGIAWAIGTKGLSCTNKNSPNIDHLYTNSLLNEGCLPKKDNNKPYPYCAVMGDSDDNDTIEKAFGALKSNCQKAFADEIIMFITFALATVLVLLGFLLFKKRGSRSSYVA